MAVLEGVVQNGAGANLSPEEFLEAFIESLTAGGTLRLRIAVPPDDLSARRKDVQNTAIASVRIREAYFGETGDLQSINVEGAVESANPLWVARKEWMTVSVSTATREVALTRVTEDVDPT